MGRNDWAASGHKCLWDGDRCILTHSGRDKIDAISQTPFSDELYELRLWFHWSLFLRFGLKIFQHLFKCHYLSQCWLAYWHLYQILHFQHWMVVQQTPTIRICSIQKWSCVLNLLAMLKKSWLPTPIGDYEAFLSPTKFTSELKSWLMETFTWRILFRCCRICCCVLAVMWQTNWNHTKQLRGIKGDLEWE